MATLIVPLKLKPGADREAYERFAREVDGPTITAEFLSVSEWHVYRAEQVLGSEEPAPFDYIEVVEVGDVGQLGQDVSSETAARLTEQLLEFVEPPRFVITERVV